MSAYDLLSFMKYEVLPSGYAVVTAMRPQGVPHISSVLKAMDITHRNRWGDGVASSPLMGEDLRRG